MMINARLDRLPASKYHVLWVALLGIAMLIETYDNAVFAFLAPSIRAQWNLSLGQIGVITSAVFVGMMIGAIVGGRLSDRYGRRPVLIWASVFYSAMSLMSAVAPNYEMLTISRVLTGVGVQAATGVVMVYAGEMFPKLVRGRAYSVLLFVGYFGSPLTALTALAIAPTGLEAWRWVFVIGSAGLLVAVAAALWLPETVRWLVVRGKDAQAEVIVQRLERSILRRGTDLGDIAPALPVTPQGSYRDLFHRRNRKRLLVTTFAFSGYIYVAYGFLSWIPTILTDRGMPQSEAIGFATVLSLSTVVGPLILFPFADKIERKSTLLLAGLLCAASLVVFAITVDPTVSVVAGFGAQLGISIMGAAFYTYIPEVFPTSIRGLGFGVVSGIARLAGIMSGLTIAVIYTGLGFQALYVVLAAVISAAGLLVAALGPRTTNRSLESISESSADSASASR